MSPALALEQQVRQLRAVLDEIGAYVFTKDRDGRYTYANALVLALFGRPLDEVLGRSDEQFFDLQRSGELRDNDRRVLEGGETLEREERNIVLPSGEERIYWTVKKPLRDEAGAIVGLCGISTDITARKRVEAELAEQRELIDAVMHYIDADIYMKDAALRYLFVNAKTARTFGRPIEEVLGRDDFALMPAEQARALQALDRAVLQARQVQAGEESLAGSDGRMHHYWTVKAPIHWRGEPALIGFSTDISELHELKEQLRLQSITDSLTGVHNRRHFQDAGRREMARSLRHGLPLTLVLIDIDHFKRVNDRFGHPGGDAVLQQVALLLQDCVRSEDLLARVGGEEFALLLPQTTVEAARPLAERVRAGVEGLRVPMPEGGGEARITVSIGLAAAEGAADSLDRLYSRTDRRLYAAKAQGRNRVAD